MRLRTEFRNWLSQVECKGENWIPRRRHKFYSPLTTIREWSELVGKGNWKDDHSAKLLAQSWLRADGFPEALQNAFSSTSKFMDTKFIFAIPEYPVDLPCARNSESMNDLFVLAKSDESLLSIAVEGKKNEGFGEKVSEITTNGRLRRLDFLKGVLELYSKDLDDICYQLLHRTASAILEAEVFNADNAMLLVHSFSDSDKSYEEYEKFVKLFDETPQPGEIVGPAYVNGFDLYFCWVNDNRK